MSCDLMNNSKTALLHKILYIILIGMNFSIVSDAMCYCNTTPNHIACYIKFEEVPAATISF